MSEPCSECKGTLDNHEIGCDMEAADITPLRAIDGGKNESEEADPIAEHHALCVEILEDALKLAKQGELQEVMVVGRAPGNQTAVLFTRALNARERIAMLTMLLWDWQWSLRQGAEPLIMEDDD